MKCKFEKKYIGDMNNMEYKAEYPSKNLNLKKKN